MASSDGGGKSVGKLLGIVGAVVIVALICWPIVGTIADKAEKTAISGAVSNAYTVFISADDANVSLDCDILFVFDGSVVKVKNNNIRNEEILEEYEDIPRVEFSELLTAGEYTGGTYVRQDEGYYFAEELSAGASLAGLCKAEHVYDFAGYRYYGRLEKCDVYLPG